MTLQHSDEQILQLVQEYMKGSSNPDFVGYREQTRMKDIPEAWSRFLWSLKHISKLGRYHNKRILDIGCGCGWHAFVLSLLDRTNQIVGVDILPSMVEGMNDCIRHMQAQGASFDLTGICCDICNADLPPESFDAIFSNEAIEHIHDMEQMVDRCRSLLKPNGTMILINDQNIYNHEVHKEINEMWEKREHSWEWSEYLRKLRPIEHGNAKPFAVMREEIVRAANPALDDTSIRAIVEATPGLLKPEIETIAINFKNSASLPKRKEIDWCRNPETGEYAERLFDPFELANMIQERGFRAKARHFFRRFPLNLANSIQFQPLNKMLFNMRPLFVIYAEKQA